MKKLFATVAFIALMSTGAAFAEDFAGKTVKLGIDPTFPPMEFKNADGKFEGFGVDIAEAMCAEVKAKCEWVESSWDGMIPGLQARKFDAIASSMFITEKRQAQINFSNPISNSPSRLVAPKGSKLLTTVESLKGKRIGVEQGSAQETYAKEVWQVAGVEVVPYQNTDLLTADLAAGRVDASFQSDLQASESFLKKPAGAGFEFVGDAIRDQKYFGAGDGLGFRKEDTELRDAFNKALATVIANGTFKKINDKYFSVDIRAQ